MKASKGICAIYKLVDQMTQIHQHLELFILFSVSHLRRHLIMSGCVQNILTLHFYQQFDLIAIIYRRLREAQGYTFNTIKRWGKKQQLIMDCRMEWPFGSSALKKAQTSLWLVGPQLNSPQTRYPGISFHYFGSLNTSAHPTIVILSADAFFPWP